MKGHVYIFSKNKLRVIATEEKVLLQQIAGGNEKAFAVLVERKWNNIYSQALAYTKSTHYAQDVVQEVFLKIWQKRSDLPAVEHFDSFLFVVARNHIISELRKKIAATQSLDASEFVEENFIPDKTLWQKNLRELLHRAIDLLPQQQRTAYLLSRDEGLSHEEIARQMKLSKETAKKHICRALNFLRTYLRTHTDITVIVIMVILLSLFINF